MKDGKRSIAFAWILFSGLLIVTGCSTEDVAIAQGSDLGQQADTGIRDLARELPETQSDVSLEDGSPTDLVNEEGATDTVSELVDPIGDTTSDTTNDTIRDLVSEPVVDTTEDQISDPLQDPTSDTGSPGGCPNADLGSAVGTLVYTGTTVGAGDHYSSSLCLGLGNGAEDLTLLWQAPLSGTYGFDTTGSSFDTALYVLDGVCSGRELACNDDDPSDWTATSRLHVSLEEEQQVTIVVDGYGAGDEGTVVLNISASEVCGANRDLGSQIRSPIAWGFNEGYGDHYELSCGGGWYPGEDVAYLFTAPTSATYRFTTEGSEYDTVLAVLRDDCVTELGCNDDGGGGLGMTSSLDVTLSGGQRVLIVVDAYSHYESGLFYLHIFNLSHPETNCTNWNDDDGDGLYDCADPTDCTGGPECQPGSAPTGAACESHTDCAASGIGPACFYEGMGWPAGYCAQHCVPGSSDCPAGSRCVAFVGGGGHCLELCGGSHGGCRPDTMPDDYSPGATISYVCDGFGGSETICGPSWWLD